MSNLNKRVIEFMAMSEYAASSLHIDETAERPGTYPQIKNQSGEVLFVVRRALNHELPMHAVRQIIKQYNDSPAIIHEQAARIEFLEKALTQFTRVCEDLFVDDEATHVVQVYDPQTEDYLRVKDCPDLAAWLKEPRGEQS